MIFYRETMFTRSLISHPNVWEVGLTTLFLFVTLLSAAFEPQSTHLLLTVTAFMHYFLYRIFMKIDWQAKFYAIWGLESMIIIWGIFTFVSMKELALPTLACVIGQLCFLGAAISVYLIKTGACKSKVPNRKTYGHSVDHNSVTITMVGSYSEGICEYCKVIVPRRAEHCYVCGTCIQMRYHHCLWLDCCIGKHNRKIYFFFLLETIGALSCVSILTLKYFCNFTSFPMWKLLYEDCWQSSEDENFYLNMCYVIGVYSFMIIFMLVSYFLQHCWLISLGITGGQWRRHDLPIHSQCLKQSRPCLRLVMNWIRFWVE